MSGTQKLYYLEPELHQVEALLLERRTGAAAAATARGRGSDASGGAGLDLVFDRSIFYPEGGGQPCDLGSVARADEPELTVPVVAVEEDGDKIVHRLAVDPSAEFRAEPRERFILRLDEPRRRDHTEQHTAQHLLSSVLLRLFGAATVSFHLGAERCTIDVSVPGLDAGCVAETEAAIDRIIEQNYPIVTHLCPPEDPSSFSLRRAPPASEGPIRIVEIDGIDFTPCCGTHLRGTGAIRAFRLFGAERYKGMTRVSFAAGGRAIADYAALSAIAASASAALGCARAELADRAERLRLRVSELESSRRGLIVKNASLEVAAAIASKGEGALVMSLGESPADSAQEVVKAAVARGRVALALSDSELVACAAAPPGGGDLGALLKAAAAARGGKGGGGATSFRAAFPDAVSLAAFAAEAALLLGARNSVDN